MYQRGGPPGTTDWAFGAWTCGFVRLESVSGHRARRGQRLEGAVMGRLSLKMLGIWAREALLMGCEGRSRGVLEWAEMAFLGQEMGFRTAENLIRSLDNRQKCAIL